MSKRPDNRFDQTRQLAHVISSYLSGSRNAKPLSAAAPLPLTGTACELILAYIMLFSAMIAVAYYRLSYFDIANAYAGFATNSFVDPTRTSNHFVAADFPSGMSAMLKSLPIWLFSLSGQLGMTPSFIGKIMIIAEILSLTLGGIAAARLLRPDAPPASAVFVALYLCSGHMLNCDLARWFHPFYGATYNYAYGLILPGIALSIVGRLRAGAFFLGLAFATHPILGAIAAAFVVAALAVDWQRYTILEILAFLLIFVSMAVGWGLLSIGYDAVARQDIPVDMFIRLTRMMSSHWYPIELGVFTERHWEGFLPFMSFSLLLLIYLFDGKERIRGINKQLASGFICMLLLTVGGIVLSELSHNPFLIKLALHRASSMLLIVGSVVVVTGLYLDVSGPTWRALLAIVLLLSPFITRSGIPVVWALVMASLIAAPGLWQKSPQFRSLAIACALTLIGAVLIWLWWRGHLYHWRLDAYTAVDVALSFPVLVRWIVGIAVVTAIVFRVRALIAPLVAVAAIYSSQSLMPFATLEQIAKASDYLAVQQWAKNNTAPGTIFMMDPTHAYGWREESGRPSFGNVREWLYSGWIYSGDRKVFEEGISRFSEFGLVLPSYIGESVRPDIGASTMYRDLRRAYYGAEKSWFYKIHNTYKVEYFIFEKSKEQPIPPLKTVYENVHYRVMEP